VIDDLTALVIPGPLLHRTLAGGDLRPPSPIAVRPRGSFGGCREAALQFQERGLDVLSLAA